MQSETLDNKGIEMNMNEPRENSDFASVRGNVVNVKTETVPPASSVAATGLNTDMSIKEGESETVSREKFIPFADPTSILSKEGSSADGMQSETLDNKGIEMNMNEPRDNADFAPLRGNVVSVKTERVPPASSVAATCLSTDMSIKERESETMSGGKSVLVADNGESHMLSAPVSNIPFKEHHLKQLRAQSLVFLAFRNGLMPETLHLETALGNILSKEGSSADGMQSETLDNKGIEMNMNEPRDNPDFAPLRGNVVNVKTERVPPASSVAASSVAATVLNTDMSIKEGESETMSGEKSVLVADPTVIGQERQQLLATRGVMAAEDSSAEGTQSVPLDNKGRAITMNEPRCNPDFGSLRDNVVNVKTERVPPASSVAATGLSTDISIKDGESETMSGKKSVSIADLGQERKQFLDTRRVMAAEDSSAEGMQSETLDNKGKEMNMNEPRVNPDFASLRGNDVNVKTERVPPASSVAASSVAATGLNTDMSIKEGESETMSGEKSVLVADPTVIGQERQQLLATRGVMAAEDSSAEGTQSVPLDNKGRAITMNEPRCNPDFGSLRDNVVNVKTERVPPASSVAATCLSTDISIKDGESETMSGKKSVSIADLGQERKQFLDTRRVMAAEDSSAEGMQSETLASLRGNDVNVKTERVPPASSLAATGLNTDISIKEGESETVSREKFVPFADPTSIDEERKQLLATRRVMAAETQNHDNKIDKLRPEVIEWHAVDVDNEASSSRVPFSASVAQHEIVATNEGSPSHSRNPVLPLLIVHPPNPESWDHNFKSRLRNMSVAPEKRRRVTLGVSSALLIVIIWIPFIVDKHRCDTAKNCVKSIVLSLASCFLPGCFIIASIVDYLWNICVDLRRRRDVRLDAVIAVLGVVLPFVTAFSGPSKEAVFGIACCFLLWAYFCEMAFAFQNMIGLVGGMSSAATLLVKDIAENEKNPKLWSLLVIPVMINVILYPFSLRYSADLYPDNEENPVENSANV